MVLFSCLSRISVGQYCLKNVGKKVERGEGWPYRGKELSIEGRGLKPSAHYGVQDSFRRSCSAHKYFKAFNKALIAFFKILQKQTFFCCIWTKKERFEWKKMTSSGCYQTIFVLQKQPQDIFYKKVFLKFSQNSQKNTCIGVSFLLKKRPGHRFFPVSFVKFLRAPFLQNTSGRLPLVLQGFRMKFSLHEGNKAFFRKCGRVHRFLGIYSHYDRNP